MLGKTPGLDHDLGQSIDNRYSHVEITPEHHGNMFFWLFHNRHIANKQRTVIWLNGGPGCSSMDGALMEIGPYRVAKDGNLEYNKGSWDEFANVLFVDNPVGTGFSYVDTNSYVHELNDMADQMIVFLEKFFEMFPEYSHDDVSVGIPQLVQQALTSYSSTLLENRTLVNTFPILHRPLLIEMPRIKDMCGTSLAS